MTQYLDVVHDPRWLEEVAAHPYPLLFATVSGAHLYGFPSPDSDFDLRGAHVLPLAEVVGLAPAEETITLSHVRDGAEVDLVTHDVRKFFRLLLRDNGYVLEQLYSPLVVATTPEHAELQKIARGCITRRCLRHYVGFAWGQWELFKKEETKRVKTLLYVYRVLLTGIRLMQTGDLNANLPECNADRRPEDRLPYIDELVAQKREGTEKAGLDAADFTFHEREFQRLISELEASAVESPLPGEITGREALNDLLLRVRGVARTPNGEAA